jgi:hypothetical protein
MSLGMCLSFITGSANLGSDLSAKVVETNSSSSGFERWLEEPTSGPHVLMSEAGVQVPLCINSDGIITAVSVKVEVWLEFDLV